jgi:hypothetical protein
VTAANKEAKLKKAAEAATAEAARVAKLTEEEKGLERIAKQKVIELELIVESTLLIVASRDVVYVWCVFFPRKRKSRPHSKRTWQLR